MDRKEPEVKFPAYGYLIGVIVLGGFLTWWVLAGDCPSGTIFEQGQIFGALELGAILCFILWLVKR
jgi:hypothetical protein